MAPKIDTTEPHNNNSETIESKLQELKDEFLSIPEGPCVLTHGDLNLSNIMVKDGKITAIIDWEHAGFYPWWAERWLIERWGGESDVLSIQFGMNFILKWMKIDSRKRSLIRSVKLRMFGHTA